jgi:hypothetical protein
VFSKSFQKHSKKLGRQEGDYFLLSQQSDDALSQPEFFTSCPNHFVLVDENLSNMKLLIEKKIPSQ